MQDITAQLSSYWLKQVYHHNLNVFLSNVEIVKRVDRAYDILVKDNRYDMIVIRDAPLTFQLTNPEGVYYVITPSEHSCSCPDALRRTLCKHRLLVKMILECTQLQKKHGIQIRKT